MSDRLTEFREYLSSVGEDEFLSLIGDLAAVIKRIGTRSWLIKPPFFKEFERNGLHLTQNHYYSVIPDVSSLPDKLWAQVPFEGILARVNPKKQLQLLHRLVDWSCELRDIPRDGGEGFVWDNEMLPPLDAIVYYGFIRSLKPRTILEIGSGYSTQLALQAAERNDGARILCIEPFPSGILQRSSHKLDELIQSNVQDVPLDVFKRLDSGDVLFVDTSHTVKAGSDVNHIVFNILPALRDGVIIHFHDVFLPYEYPKHWITEWGFFWNEQYLILAFLMHNNAFKPLLMNYFLSKKFETSLKEKLARFDFTDLKRNMGGVRGASFWMIKGKERKLVYTGHPKRAGGQISSK